MNFFLQVYCIDFAQDQQSDIYIYIYTAHSPHRAMLWLLCPPLSGTGVSLSTGSWRCSTLRPGRWRPSCPRWLRWRTGCRAAPGRSPQTGWAPGSGSRRTPCGTGRSRCSRRPESDPGSQWRAPSRGRGGNLEGRQVQRVKAAGRFQAQVSGFNEWVNLKVKKCNELDILTFKEGDLQLGRLSGVLTLGRADDSISGSVVPVKDE